MSVRWTDTGESEASEGRFRGTRVLWVARWFPQGSGMSFPDPFVRLTVYVGEDGSLQDVTLDQLRAALHPQDLWRACADVAWERLVHLLEDLKVDHEVPEWFSLLHMNRAAQRLCEKVEGLPL